MKKILISIILLFSINCKNPKCDTTIENIEVQKKVWFENHLSTNASYFFSESYEKYKNKNIYINSIDLTILDNVNCQTIKSEFSSNLSLMWPNSLHPKFVQLVDNQSQADYIAYARFVKVEQRPKWAKYFFLAPFRNADIGGWWFKLVNVKTNKIAFAYYSYAFSIESKNDLVTEFNKLSSTIDKYSGESK